MREKSLKNNLDTTDVFSGKATLAIFWLRINWNVPILYVVAAVRKLGLISLFLFSSGNIFLSLFDRQLKWIHNNVLTVIPSYAICMFISRHVNGLCKLFFSSENLEQNFQLDNNNNPTCNGHRREPRKSRLMMSVFISFVIIIRKVFESKISHRKNNV